MQSGHGVSSLIMLSLLLLFLYNSHLLILSRQPRNIMQFIPPANNIVDVNASLKCGEEWIHNHDEEDDDDDFRGPITFHIQLPSQDSNSNNQRLKFSCRDKSSGVLLKSEPSVSKEDTFDGPCDP